MDRRTWLRTSGMGIVGMSVGACASGARGLPRGGSPDGRVRLAPVRASWDRVVRTTVGLRPFRPSGFSVRAERLDAATVIHNYGHGGAGHSLAWGTGLLASELALEHPERRAAVIGCGAAGLTTARQLQRRGFDVTIYAMSVPPDTTSNMALAGWTPTSGLVENAHRTAAWDAQFRRAARAAYAQLQLLVGRGYGVSWIDSYTLMSSPPERSDAREGGLLPADLRPTGTLLGPEEHPFPSPYVSVRPTLRIEPAAYLDALVDGFRRAGGRIVIRRFESPRDLVALDERLLVNCTGLGSRDLFADRELRPVKGQLTLLVPQQDVRYATFGGVPRPGRDQGFIHMMPRADGIALGGTSQPDVWSLEPDERARNRIVERHIELFDAMRAADRAGRVASGPWSARRRTGS